MPPLNMSCSNGKAAVTLHAKIGLIDPPSSQAPQTPVKRRNPAYQRRIAKRHAMRQTEHHSDTILVFCKSIIQ